MFKLENLIRKNILALKPYSSAREEFKGNAEIFLDANENPFGELNRYPDPYQVKLKQKLSECKGIPAENIFIGNGSDEIIDLCYRIFCNPGSDKVVVFPPTYGMYEVSANINDVKLLEVKLDRNYQIDLSALPNLLENEQSVKMIFICSPNNPTGNAIDEIEDVLKMFEGIVFVDEAYIDFSEKPSMLSLLEKYPNLIVSQTFSKAWGLAAARLGVAYASKEIISFFNKVKPPYNVSSINQKAGIAALEDQEKFVANKNLILKERQILEDQLRQMTCVKRVYPTNSNFILIESNDGNKLYAYLRDRGIIIRNRGSQIENCVRLTVGTPEENQKLITAIKQFENEKSTVC
jgi:histidinol-phosphate aminotransferase